MKTLAKFTIPLKLPTLNEYTKENRGNKYGGNKVKKLATNICRLNCLKIDKITVPITLHFHWGIGRHDPDNVCFAKKFILDGMQEANKIENDGFKQVKAFSDTFEKVKKGQEFVEVTIKESEYEIKRITSHN